MESLPKTIGPYRILEALGRGGMGVVYRAVRQDEGRVVALKTVRVTAESQLAGLRREIHALARLRHPGIVRIVEEGVADGLPWYAMELLEGMTLRRHHNELGPSAAQKRPSSFLPADPEGTRPEWWTQTLDGGPAGTLPPSVGLESAPGSGPTFDAAAVSPPPGPAGRIAYWQGLVRRLCVPLAYLHGEGLVHRDLKLENVLVRP